jgi:hypothetical protein
MDFDPAFGRLGTTNPNRSATELASEARRSIPPPEIDRAAVAPATDRDTYASAGLRPPGDFARDVILQLSPKALALAKSATTDPELIKEVEADGDGDDEVESARGRQASDAAPQPHQAPRPRHHRLIPRIDVRA